MASALLGIEKDRVASYLREKVDEGFDVKPNTDTMVMFVLNHYEQGCSTFNEFRDISKNVVANKLNDYMGDETDEFVDGFIKFVKDNASYFEPTDAADPEQKDKEQKEQEQKEQEQKHVEQTTDEAESSRRDDPAAEITDRMQEVSVTDNIMTEDARADANDEKKKDGEGMESDTIIEEKEEGEITETRGAAARSRSRSRGRNSRQKKDDHSPGGREVIVLESSDEEESRSLDLRREEVRARLKKRMERISRKQHNLAARLKELEQEQRAVRETLEKIDGGDDGYVLLLDQMESKQDRRRRERRKPTLPAPKQRRESRIINWRRRGSMVPARNIRDIAGKWIMRYHNGFATTYTIYQDGTLTLPRLPPEERDVRARLYGATIHGWNGRARVRIENGKFQFLPTGYRPGNNGRNDRTAWEEASLDEHGRLHSNFFKGSKFITNGEGKRLTTACNY